MTEHEIEIAIARELTGATADHKGPRHTVKGAREVMEAAAPERTSRVALLAELEDLRLTFQDLRHALASPEAKTAGVTGRWTALDVVAHLASWAVETRREMERLLARIPFDYAIHFEAEGGPRAWNQREVDDRAELGLSELVDELNTETERLVDLVLNAPAAALEEVVELPRTSGEPPQRWRMPLGAMVLGSCWHARLHLRRLVGERRI
jgi:hypothetical protein